MNVPQQIDQLARSASYIAENVETLDGACRDAYAGWKPDGRGKGANELAEANLNRKRILADMQEHAKTINQLLKTLNNAQADLQAAFQIVTAVRSIKQP